MQRCDLSCIKYLLFAFNLLFAISGIGLIVTGAVILSDVGEYKHFMEGRILAPPVVLIVAGCIVFFVASLGCFGAIRESYNLLVAFAVCLLIIFIIELAVGIAACVFRSDFDEVMKKVMKESMDNYEASKADQIAWDNLQSKLKCCGIDAYDDWPDSDRPLSCCHPPENRENVDKPQKFHCNAARPGDTILYANGCYGQLHDKANSAAKILIGVGIGIAFVELVGIILACWLASAIKNRE